MLDLYEEPYDAQRPVVCFDERPCQLIGEVRDPLPVKPGEIREDRLSVQEEGTCHVLMGFEPLTGWREAVVTERRRKREFAYSMRRLAEEATRGPRRSGWSWTTSPPTRLPPSTKASVGRLPGNWLEGSSSLHAGAWLVAEHGGDRDLGVGQAVSQAKVAGRGDSRAGGWAWEKERNRVGASVDWRFTTKDARIKLRSLYPSTEE